MERGIILFLCFSRKVLSMVRGAPYLAASMAEVMAGTGDLLHCAQVLLLHTFACVLLEFQGGGGCPPLRRVGAALGIRCWSSTA